MKCPMCNEVIVNGPGEHMLHNHLNVYIHLKDRISCPVCYKYLRSWTTATLHLADNPDCLETILVDALLESL